MVTPSLWAEITISGFFYLMAIFFFILRILGLKDLTPFDGLKEYLAFLSIGAVAASYILGVLAHRLIPILLIIFKYLSTNKTRKAQTSNTNNKELHFHNLVNVFQYGSSRLNKEMDFQFSLLALLKSLTVALPIFTMSFLFWLSSAAESNLTLLLLGILLFMCMSMFVSFRIQESKYRMLQKAAFSEVLLVKQKKDRPQQEGE